MSAKIFDLEQKILNCWGVVDDIDDVFEAVCNENMTPDDIQNALLGLKTIYQIKFNHTFQVFEDVCKEYWDAKKGIKNGSEGN